MSSDLRSSDREVDTLLLSYKGKRHSVGEGRNRGRYSQSPAVSEHMRPLSKYDNKPRNVEFDGSNFVMSARRQSGPTYRERRGKKVIADSDEEEVVGTTVSVSEFDFVSDDDDLTTQAEGDAKHGKTRVKGRVEAGRRGANVVMEIVRECLRWFMKAGKLRLAVLAGIMGLVFGVGYRGGVSGGLFTEWISKGTVC